MFFKGFRFAMLLQIAVGPVCMFIFKTANEYGIVAAEAAVIAVVMVDALYVGLAIAGVGAVLEKPRVKSLVKLGGALVMTYFGLGIALEVFGLSVVPTFKGAAGYIGASNAFVTALILTLSNPLTILFWTGVFAARLSEENFGRRDTVLFGLGAIAAPWVFLSLISVLAGLLHTFFSPIVMDILNLLVGVGIIGFGLRTFLRKEATGTAVSG